MDGQDVVRQLQVLQSHRGALPLVWSTDNGSAYCNAVVERFLERQRVVHLRNVPRTPQHNGWAERAIGELKAESGLRGDGVLASDAEALERLAAAHERLDGRRLRAKLGGRTAVQADRSDRCWYSAADRERFYADTRRAQQAAAATAHTARERRRAERRAVLEALEQLNNQSTHRGDASPAAEKGEGIL
jgi:transposase InsO family protein